MIDNILLWSTGRDIKAMGKHVLNNNRLQVVIDIEREEYKGTRFDTSGMISEIILDGKYRFASIESLIPGVGSGGRGLYNEFGIEDPIGYNEIGIGEKFPKIGVGLLTKDSELPYDFFHNYEVEHFETECFLRDNEIVLSVEPKECNGYSVRYMKSIRITENKLKISYFLENVGSKKVETTEYCHNFVGINDQPVGPDYCVRFSYPVAMENNDPRALIQGNTLTWNESLEKVFYTKLSSLPKEGNQWYEIYHKGLQVGVRETVDFPLERVAIWGMPHVISPEAFFKIDLPPGDCIKWVREYEFFQN